MKGCTVWSSARLSLPVYTRMESFPLQLTAVSADGHPSRLTLTARLEAVARSRTAPRAGESRTARMQPPKPAQHGCHVNRLGRRAIGPTRQSPVLPQRRGRAGPPSNSCTWDQLTAEKPTNCLMRFFTSYFLIPQLCA